MILAATTQVQHQILINLGPVVQSIVNFTNLLKVKMFTVLVSTISNSQVFLLKNLSCFFSKNIGLCTIFNDQSFNATLTNDIVNFKQLDPGLRNHIYKNVKM